MIRKSTTEWQGDGPSGSGSLNTESGALQAQPYSFKTRFQAGHGGKEDGKAVTNPEELLGAALAACFSMTVAFILTEAGHAPKRLKVTSAVDISKVGAGSASPRSRSISRRRSKDSPSSNSESSPGSQRRTVQSRKRFPQLPSPCPHGLLKMDSRFLMTMEVAVVGPQRIGAVPHGTRVTAPIASGHFEGPRLRGKVLPGAGDWTLLRGDGVLELDLRVTLETDDGALIHMTSFGLRHGPPEVIAAIARGERADPSTYYFRTTPRFETSHPKYVFLNRLLAVSSGDRRATGPIYTIDELL